MVIHSLISSSFDMLADQDATLPCEHSQNHPRHSRAGHLNNYSSTMNSRSCMIRALVCMAADRSNLSILNTFLRQKEEKPKKEEAGKSDENQKENRKANNCIP